MRLPFLFHKGLGLLLQLIQPLLHQVILEGRHTVIEFLDVEALGLHGHALYLSVVGYHLSAVKELHGNNCNRIIIFHWGGENFTVL